MSSVIPKSSKSPFPFCYSKAAEVAATLLRQEPHWQMNYYRLLKLIYIADRIALQETGRPIVGGRLVAMQRGPLHTTCRDLITGQDSESPWWMRHFQTQHYDVVMLDDPGNHELSKREIEIVNRVRTEHLARDEWEVGEYTNSFSEFEENRPPNGKVREIPFEQLLAAVGRSADQAQIEKEAREKSVFDSVFGA